MKNCTLSSARRSGFELSVVRCVFMLAGIMLISGCAKPQLYDWGDYADSLECRYEKGDAAQAEQALREQMVEYGTGKHVPPGVYADYGFLLFRRGDIGGALAYFEKEKSTFPESSYLMDKLIARIKKKTSPAPDKVATEAGGGQP